MKPIIHIKDGLLSNLAAIAFLLGLSGFVAWLDQRFNGHVSKVAWVFCAVWVLCCYFPINAIRRPKSRLLAIDGDCLVWRVRTKEEASVNEERIPLRSLRTLEFIVPQEVGSRNSRLRSSAQLFFVTAQRSRHELPLDFFPGVYQKKIVAAIRRHVPDIEVVERVDDTA